MPVWTVQAARIVVPPNVYGCVKLLWPSRRLPTVEAPHCKSRKETPAQKLGDDHDLGMLLAACADTPLPEPADWEGKEQSPLVVRDCRAPRFVFPAVNAENAVS